MNHLIVEQNTRGRDFFISDIHGHKPKFERALARVAFNPEQGDRLFCVGDLIDRGTDNLQILGKQLHWDYFYSTIGNHEVMLMEAFEESPVIMPYSLDVRLPSTTHSLNGGKWFSKLRQSLRERVYQQIKALPLTLEVKTQWGTIGIVHAEVPSAFDEWNEFVDAVQTQSSVREKALWQREFIETALRCDASNLSYPEWLTKPVKGIDAVLHGHTPIKQPKVLGNRLYFDTGLEIGEHTILSAEQVFGFQR